MLLLGIIAIQLVEHVQVQKNLIVSVAEKEHKIIHFKVIVLALKVFILF